MYVILSSNARVFQLLIYCESSCLSLHPRTKCLSADMSHEVQPVNFCVSYRGDKIPSKSLLQEFKIYRQRVFYCPYNMFQGHNSGTFFVWEYPVTLALQHVLVTLSYTVPASMWQDVLAFVIWSSCKGVEKRFEKLENQHLLKCVEELENQFRMFFSHSKPFHILTRRYWTRSSTYRN